MTTKKKKTNRGRPPRYVLDEDGKEVIGLSYNSTNRMFYATGTSPRHYFKIGNVKKEITYCSRFYVTLESVKLKEAERKKEAIRLFHEWKAAQEIDSENLDTLKTQDEIYVRARRMIEEGVFDDLIEEKAKELISNDESIQDEIISRAKTILEEITSQGTYSGSGDSELEKKIHENILKVAKEYIWKYAPEEYFNDDITFSMKKLIENDHYRAARLLDMPYLAKLQLLKDDFETLPFTWSEFWIVFIFNKDMDSYLYDKDLYKNVYDTIGNNIPFSKTYSISYDIFAEAFYKCIDKNGEITTTQLNSLFSDKTLLIILEDIFITIKDSGYPQAIPVLGKYSSEHKLL